jgi:hypothetical protein
MLLPASPLAAIPGRRFLHGRRQAGRVSVGGRAGEVAPRPPGDPPVVSGSRTRVRSCWPTYRTMLTPPEGRLSSRDTRTMTRGEPPRGSWASQTPTGRAHAGHFAAGGGLSTVQMQAGAWSPHEDQEVLTHA